MTSDNLHDFRTLLAYDYEDGKIWHDQTCVLEIIFNNYQYNVESDRIRIMYDFSYKFLMSFSAELSIKNTFIKQILKCRMIRDLWVMKEYFF